MFFIQSEQYIVGDKSNPVMRYRARRFMAPEDIKSWIEDNEKTIKAFGCSREPLWAKFLELRTQAKALVKKDENGKDLPQTEQPDELLVLEPELNAVIAQLNNLDKSIANLKSEVLALQGGLEFVSTPNIVLAK